MTRGYEKNISEIILDKNCIISFGDKWETLFHIWFRYIYVKSESEVGTIKELERYVCTWKRQLARSWSWKFLSWKSLYTWQNVKLESFFQLKACQLHDIFNYPFQLHVSSEWDRYLKLKRSRSWKVWIFPITHMPWFTTSPTDLRPIQLPRRNKSTWTRIF